MNTHAITDVMEEVIYLTFVVIFIVFVLFYLSRASTDASFYEELYAKHIGLAIDKVSNGMELEIGLYTIYEIARKQKFTGSVVMIDNENNIVRVTSGGKGYEQHFFSNFDIVWSVDPLKKVLTLYAIKPGGNDV